MVLRFPDSWSNWNLKMLEFEERGKPESPEKNLSEKRREPTTNSTHVMSQLPYFDFESVFERHNRFVLRNLKYVRSWWFILENLKFLGHLRLIKLFFLNLYLTFTAFMVPQMHLNLVGMAKTDNRTHKWFNLFFSSSNFPGKIGFSSYDSRSMAQFSRELK